MLVKQQNKGKEGGKGPPKTLITEALVQREELFKREFTKTEGLTEATENGSQYRYVSGADMIEEERFELAPSEKRGAWRKPS